MQLDDNNLKSHPDDRHNAGTVGAPRPEMESVRES